MRRISTHAILCCSKGSMVVKMWQDVFQKQNCKQACNKQALQAFEITQSKDTVIMRHHYPLYVGHFFDEALLD